MYNGVCRYNVQWCLYNVQWCLYNVQWCLYNDACTMMPVQWCLYNDVCPIPSSLEPFWQIHNIIYFLNIIILTFDLCIRDDFQALDDKLVPEKRFPRQSLPTFQSRLDQSTPILTSCTGNIEKDMLEVGGGSATQCLIAPVRQNTQTIAFVVLLSEAERWITTLIFFIFTLYNVILVFGIASCDWKC